MMPGPGTEESFWFSTRSDLFRAEAGWPAIAAYRPSLLRYLASRYPRLSSHDCEDLASGIMLEMRERLVPRHDPSRGRFRQLLQVAIRHRVIDFLRRQRPALPLDEDPPAPLDHEVDALDLEVGLLEAMAAARDSLTQGPEADPEALYAFADRVVHGRSNRAIAQASGVSVDRVARLLRRVRERVLTALLRRELDSEEALEAAGALVRKCWQRPVLRARLLEQMPDAGLRAELEAFLTRFEAARGAFPSLSSPAGEELQRGLRLLLS